MRYFDREPTVDLPIVPRLMPVASTKGEMRRLARVSSALGRSGFVRTSGFDFNEIPDLPPTGPERLQRGLLLADAALHQAGSDIGVSIVPHDWVLVRQPHTNIPARVLPTGFRLGAYVAPVKPVEQTPDARAATEAAITERIEAYKASDRKVFVTSFGVDQIVYGTTAGDPDPKPWFVDVEPRISHTPNPDGRFSIR